MQATNQKPAIFNDSLALDLGETRIMTLRRSDLKPIIRIGRILKAGKNKGQFKADFGHYFNTDTEAGEYLKNYIQKYKAIAEAAEAAKTAFEQAKKETKHPFEVGAVLYSSWGYEQTNVDFYQVTENKGKVIVLQRLESVLVSQDRGDSGKIAPIVGKFYNDQKLTKKVRPYQYNGKIEFCVTINSFARAYLYTAGEAGAYCSWGY